VSDDRDGGDGADDGEGPGESCDVSKNELAPVTDVPGVRSVQEVVSDGSDGLESGVEREGELNELAPVTDAPGIRSVQKVVEDPGDDCVSDGEVSDGE